MAARAAHIHSFLFLLLILRIAFAKESAWNGYTPEEPSKPTPFVPYYVPPGARSIDSSSPLVHYHGKWEKSLGYRYVKHTKHYTFEDGAAVSLVFHGERIECYGTRDQRHGVFEVLIDGSHITYIDNWSDSPEERSGQLIYAVDGLKSGRHTIKLVHRPQKNRRSTLAFEAFVFTPHRIHTLTRTESRSIAPRETPLLDWSLLQKGSTGVNAMQLAVVTERTVLIIDKVEHNPLTVDGHPAWASEYDLHTHNVKPVRLQSNSFCAGGSFLGNGTLVNVGGNPVVEDHTGAADFGDVDGIQAIRLYHPCDPVDEECSFYENPARIRMASSRWYPTVLRISDGSAMIIGGSIKGGWINNATVNNPTIEYYPPKSIHGSKGSPIQMPFLKETVGANLFPIAISLPDGRVFITANRDAIIYDWQSNIEIRLPRLPNGVRVTYPMAGTGLLLPLSHENDYTPTVLLCGGSAIDDQTASYEISSQTPASSQCVRMALNDDGIKAGWEVEHMPQARLMPDAIHLPTGQVLIINGAESGISGYGNVKDQIGASNAANPVFTPVLYDPLAEAGHRFSSHGMPTSDIARLYHSVATMTPQGNIMIAGSNPNLDRSEVAYGTEYRVEWLNPPYMGAQRPKIANFKKVETIPFGQTVSLRVENCGDKSEGRGVFMDLGFVTHANHMHSRMVYAKIVQMANSSWSITTPPNGKVYPPGPAWMYFLCDGIPSEGKKVILGDGRSPPVDKEAIAHLLKSKK
ncbi:hypothetical protein L218DRAFT_986303 [Marasmius fiardii PR-910]|nr:hypothetical protein L218DRAFT_986303 [Marasmius fiardii PR-910]